MKQPTSLSVDESHPCKVQKVWLGEAGSHRDGGESWRYRMRTQRTWKPCPGTPELAQLCWLDPRKEKAGSCGALACGMCICMLALVWCPWSGWGCFRCSSCERPALYPASNCCNWIRCRFTLTLDLKLKSELFYPATNFVLSVSLMPLLFSHVQESLKQLSFLLFFLLVQEIKNLSGDWPGKKLMMLSMCGSWSVALPMGQKRLRNTGLKALDH